MKKTGRKKKARGPKILPAVRGLSCLVWNSKVVLLSRPEVRIGLVGGV